MRLVEARFLERPNRFLVLADLQGEVVPCHLPNPGRLQELLLPGARLSLRRQPRHQRKTAYDVAAVRTGDVLVSVDTRLPNRAVRRALEARILPEFQAFTQVLPEVALGDSRMDFLLRDGKDCYLEVKSVTLVEDGVALFPDAPTERGRRHVQELAEAVRGGLRAAILFLVQRPDARLFRPRDATDPRFGEALRRAHGEGVEVYAYRSRFDGGALVDLAPLQISLAVG